MILFSCLSNGIYHLGGLMLSLLCLIAVRFRALTSGSIVKTDFSFRSIVQSSYILKLNKAFSEIFTHSESGLL